MAAYYLDTSALLKRYAWETGTTWVRQLTDSVLAHDILTVRLTGPEMIAALSRKANTGGITPAEAARAAVQFRLDWQGVYRIIEVSAVLADHAMTLAERHYLRGYDAVHLAAALAAQQGRSAFGLSPLTFVSADTDQLRAAIAEGLSAENPNAYP